MNQNVTKEGSAPYSNGFGVYSEYCLKSGFHAEDLQLS